ncbi:unnamed protein product [Trichobilharzia regenti]|nr:unnamed protein product [Trichobilharzia regenti]
MRAKKVKNPKVHVLDSTPYFWYKYGIFSMDIDTIIYQLSNRKYIEQGWTVSHTNKYNTHDNDDDDDNGDLTGNQQGESIQLNGYSPELQEVTSTNLSSLNLDYIQQEYSNGEVFIRNVVGVYLSTLENSFTPSPEVC